jgi:glutamine amidotransferase
VSKGPNVVVFDYGFGNVRSAERAMQRLGARCVISSDVAVAAQADGLIVPGVGAFAACMAGLVDAGGPLVIRDRIASGRPILGICVGMQVMFERGVEHGQDVRGLGYWPGVVDRLESPVLPHMGWNTVKSDSPTNLFAGLAGERFYFVHSYATRSWSKTGFSSAASDPSLSNPELPGEATLSWCEYGGGFVAAVEQGALVATQFHPEKSGDAGMHLLKNWSLSLA